MTVKKVKETLSKLDKHSKYILALSGGVDSMCLYDLLKKEFKKQNKDLTDLVCVHYNHQLREESKTEYTNIENIVKKDGAIFHGVTLDVIEYCENNKVTMETGARELRYKGFVNACSIYGTNKVILGHHGDDVIEGVLMRLVSGSHGKGLISMTKKHTIGGIDYLRPMLDLQKSELYAYAEENDITFYEDVTNQDDTIKRNRYRKSVLPLLKAENCNVHQTFVTFSQEKKEDESFFDLMVDEFLIKNTKFKIVNGIPLIQFNIEAFEGLHISIQKRVFKKMMDELGRNELLSKNLLFEFLDALNSKKLITVNKKVLYYRKDVKSGVLIAKEYFDEMQLEFSSVNEKQGNQKLKASLRCKDGSKIAKKYNRIGIPVGLREYSYAVLENNAVVKIKTPFKELEV